MSGWQLVFSRAAQKDAKKLRDAGLNPKAQQLLAVLEEDPFRSPPRFEKLVGDLSGCYSRRINVWHRLVYAVEPEQKVTISCACGHVMSDGEVADAQCSGSISSCEGTG